MSRSQLRRTLIETLSEIQDLNEQPMPEVDDDTCPMEDLPGFDSLTAAEALVMLSDKLDYELEPSILVKPDGNPATVGEIIDSMNEVLYGERIGQ